MVIDSILCSRTHLHPHGFHGTPATHFYAATLFNRPVSNTRYATYSNYLPSFFTGQITSCGSDRVMVTRHDPRRSENLLTLPDSNRLDPRAFDF